MDNLEKFVRDNRQEFDDKMPKMLVWEGIEARLQEGKTGQKDHQLKVVSLRTRIYQYAKVAAIALILLTLGGFIGSYWTMQQAEKLTFGNINEDYEELEMFYTERVNIQMERLQKYHYDKTLMQDIKELDIAFNELKMELKKQNEPTDNEMIIHEMIDNYQSKLDILERVLEHLERNKQHTIKKNKHEKVKL